MHIVSIISCKLKSCTLIKIESHAFICMVTIGVYPTNLWENYCKRRSNEWLYTHVQAGPATSESHIITKQQ